MQLVCTLFSILDEMSLLQNQHCLLLLGSKGLFSTHQKIISCLLPQQVVSIIIWEQNITFKNALECNRKKFYFFHDLHVPVGNVFLVPERCFTPFTSHIVSPVGVLERIDSRSFYFNLPFSNHKNNRGHKSELAVVGSQIVSSSPTGQS